MRRGFLFAGNGRGRGGPPEAGTSALSYREVLAPPPSNTSPVEVAIEHLGRVSTLHQSPDSESVEGVGLEPNHTHEATETPRNTPNDPEQAEIKPPHKVAQGSDGVYTLSFEEEEYAAVVDKYVASTILLYFLGKPPNEEEFRSWMNLTWQPFGWQVERVRYLGKGYFAVIFCGSTNIYEVLSHGSWTYRGGLVLVQPWDKSFSPDTSVYGFHPAWVELCNLPLHLWPFARRIFEQIGKVLKFEENHEFTWRPHVRACLLVDTNRPLPKKLMVSVGDEVEYEVKFLVLGLPNACFRCKQAGHFIRDCPYKQGTSNLFHAPVHQ